MKKFFAAITLCAVSFCFAAGLQVSAAKDDAVPQKMLSHNIYFSLAEPTPENKQRLVDACNKYLAPHPGVDYFASGVLCEEQKNIFNDRDYDVALVMTFKDRKALGVYARTPEHQKFIAETTALLKKVRIFDADVSRVAVPDDK